MLKFVFIGISPTEDATEDGYDSTYYYSSTYHESNVPMTFVSDHVICGRLRYVVSKTGIRVMNELKM